MSHLLFKPLRSLLLVLWLMRAGSSNVFDNLDCYQGAHGFDSAGEPVKAFDPHYYGKPQLHKISQPMIHTDPLVGHMFISQWNGKWIEVEEQHVLKEFQLLGKNTLSTRFTDKGQRKIVVDVGE